MDNFSVKLLPYEKFEFLNRTTFLNNSFDKHVKFIQNKTFLYKLTEMLTLLLKNNNITILDAKNLMSSYTIYGFSEIVLNNPKDEYDNELYKSSEKLLNSLENLFKNNNILTDNNLELFNINYDNFTTLFKLWKKKDLLRVIKPYILSYYQYEVMLTEMENPVEEKKTGKQDIEIWCNEIHKLQNKIKSNIFKICGKDGIQLLNNYQPPQITIDQKVYQQIEDNIKKSFWKIFYDKIEHNNYEMIPDMLLDVKNMLFNLVPNRSDIHNRFNNEIDIDLIKQMVENNAINSDEIYKIMISIVEYIKMLQAAEDDNNTLLFLEDVNNWFKNKQSYAFILTNYFQTIFNKLEKITKTVIELTHNNPDVLK